MRLRLSSRQSKGYVGRWLLYWNCLVVGVVLACGSAWEGNSEYGTRLPEVPVWSVFEQVLPVPVVEDNPFDPSEVSVECVFVAPEGRRSSRVPAYVTRDYQRELVEGYEHLEALGDLYWKVRFTPSEQGIWRWYWQKRTPLGTETSPWSSFVATDPAPSKHGFLRVGQSDQQYLVFDDGTSYVAVGENLCWYDARGTCAYDDWLMKLASQGATFIRLWMPSWAFGLEWVERDGQGNIVATSLGNYRRRLDRAWQLDYVVRRCEELGIYVMLCIQNHGPFSRVHNSEWADNPYNAAWGGPLATPRDFFTSSEAKELFKRRLRYIVSRWGYSPHILAWELWNEVDLVEYPSEDMVVQWHQEMARELRSLDPYGRLITTSVSGTPAIIHLLTGSSPLARLWELPDIDLVQLHFYSVAGIPVNFAELFPAMTSRLRSYGKPVLLAEAGVDFRGPQETLRVDPESVAIHDMLWLGIFSQTVGTGMTWWWDNLIDPKGLYTEFGPIASFVKHMAFGTSNLEENCLQVIGLPKGLKAFSLCGDSVLGAWIKNNEHQYYRYDDRLIAGVSVGITGCQSGTWNIRWIDTSSGETVEETVRAISGGTEQIQVPPFKHDIALRLDLVR